MRCLLFFIRRCAAKSLHRELLFDEYSRLSDLYDRFIDECLCLSRLKHPNVVQLIGVHFEDPELPVPIIIMERLPMSLLECLKKYPRLPPHLECSILLDVASGLRYLHGQNPPIMHRDLTANNVLLTSHMQAKISDLGQAKLLEQAPTRKKTTGPGNICYMPPEALVTESKYSTKIDVFSFGVLVIHVATHEWPFRKTYRDPKTGRVMPPTEVEQRKIHLDKMERESPLRLLAESCLNDDPNKRPETVKLAEDLTKNSPRSPFANTLEMELALESQSAKARLLETRLQEIDTEVRAVLGDSSSDTQQLASPSESTLAEAYTQLQDIAAVNQAVLAGVGSPELIVGYKSPTNNGKNDMQISLVQTSSAGGNMDVVVRAPLSIHITGTLVRTIEGMKEPWGLVAGSRDQVLVTNGRGYKGVLCYNRMGESCGEYVPSHYSYEREVEGKCYYPRGIDLDGEGGFILADTWCHRIQRFKISSDLKKAEFEKSVGSKGEGEGQFNLPQSVRVSKETGDVYVCDKDNHRIQVFDRDLQFKSSFGERGDDLSNFHYPQDIDFDSQGNIYVADCGHYVVKVFNKDFEFQRSIGGEGRGKGHFHYISSICIDRQDYLYVTDKTWNCVQVFDPAGEFVMQINLPPLNQKSTTEPRGISVDKQGFVYVSCMATGCVHIYK